jgi:hypothetical protein
MDIRQKPFFSTVILRVENKTDNIHTSRYSSVERIASCEKTRASPLVTCFAASTTSPAMLPWPIKETLTGKNEAESSPPTVNSSEPEFSDALTSAMFHSSEWEDGLRDQSPE